MILTFAFDPPAIFLAGLSSSLLAIDPRDGRPWFARASFGCGLVFGLGFYAVTLGCHAVAPDWMSHYRLDRPLGPWGLALAGALLYVGPYLAGYGLGLESRRSSMRVWAAAFIAGIVLLGGVLVATADSLFHVGTREEFAAGTAVPLWRHGALSIVLGIGSATLGPYAIVSALVARRRFARWEARPDSIRRVFDLEQTAVVQAIAERLFPPLPGVDDHAGRWELGEEFSRYCAEMPAVQKLGLRLAADLVQYLPILYLGRPRRFTSLGGADQDRYLERLSHTRVIPLQILFLLFKTGLSLLYYERPEVAAAVRASPTCRRTRPS